MSNPQSLSRPATSRGTLALSVAAVEAVMGSALAAHRTESLRELLAQRPLLTRWIVRRLLAPVLGSVGDALGDDVHAQATLLTLRWAVSQLRPDQRPFASPIADDAWLERTSWRPALAVLCHFGFTPVPDFNARYRRRPSESPAENLCGLWSVGPSTFYRYLDKGKRLLAQSLAAQPIAGKRRLSLRGAALAELAVRAGWSDEDARTTWHRDTSGRCLAQRDPASALWHLLQAGDVDGGVGILRRFRIELAGDLETDALIELLSTRPLQPKQEFELCLALAALWRTRDSEERALQKYEQALRVAAGCDDALMLGRVYGMLGWFHESRDTDRALACFEESVEFLGASQREPACADGSELRCEYVASLVRLAWLYVLRNDPRSKTVLDNAQSLRGDPGLPPETIAMLEQAWGEYWRRAGELRLAIEHKLRALNLFERLGDTRQILSTYNNLSLLYVEARDYDRALRYARQVVEAAAHKPIDPYVHASAELNMGVAYFWQTRWSDAIEHYRAGLQRSLSSNLNVIANRARYNLAEALYKRFLDGKDPADEADADAHIGAVLRADVSERDAWSEEAAPRLKAEILGDDTGLRHERLLPEETAVHPHEMAQIARHRPLLTLPHSPQDHIRAHLAIANAYLAISTKEREAALALIRQHDLGNEFDAEIDALRMTFSRELTKEKVLQARWKQKSYGVLTEERAGTVLRQVLDAGSINKSGYAQLCQVGLATASKHLGTLAERGLLAQVGKGPSTRYVLP